MKPISKPTWETVAQAKRSIAKQTLDLVAYILQSKYGFAKCDILRFYQDMANVSEMIAEGRLNMTDVVKANQEEIGVVTHSDI